jgi:protein phosphatase
MSEVSPQGPITVSSDSVCDRGLVREENQDNVRTASLPLGELFIVADGIGGYQGGATASQMVVDGFHSQLAIKPASYSPDDALKEACAYTNHSIHTAASSGDPAKQRMGSTVVLALIQTSGPSGPMAWIGHVGDSRAYLIRNNQLQKITSDHSAVQALLSRNLITEEEARNHPDSSVLTRSLGHRTEVELEIDHEPLLPGDALLLCSDGLWGYVDEALIAGVVTDPSLSIKTVTDALLRLALDAGGQDNIGIQYIRLSGGNPSITAPLAASFPSASSFPGAPSSTSNAGPPKSPPRTGKLQTVAIALLLVAGVGFAGIRYWSRIGKLIHGNQNGNIVIQPAPNDKPAAKGKTKDKSIWTNITIQVGEAACPKPARDQAQVYTSDSSVDISALNKEIAKVFGDKFKVELDHAVYRPFPRKTDSSCEWWDEYKVVVLPKDASNSVQKRTNAVSPTTEIPRVPASADNSSPAPPSRR